ncbi:MAG: butyrate kinase [Bacteroidales bacterium]|nr:butyrate kinase [Bacteroidales bacterium]MDY0199235.1 butyrate kinase [Tenuifilaceae bacterium]
MDNFKILAINPGSTSTKIAVYCNSKSEFLKTIRHTSEELQRFARVTDQFEFRKEIILQELKEAQIEINKISAVVGRGGLIKPIESGVYEVNDRMKEDLKNSIRGEHASNLGALIADNIAVSLPNAKAYIADPVVVDELQDIARIAGHPKFERVSIFHALNQKAIARQYAKSLDKKYEELNLIVAHLGGGISVGAHYMGHVIDVNNALDGEGPFSPERTGTVPAGQLAKLCFSGEYTYDEVKQMLTGKGGLVGHTGSNDAYDLEVRAKSGDKKAQLLQDAMSYNIAKHIGQMAVVLKGRVDGIILTGGIAHNSYLVEYIKEMVGFVAPVAVYPGEDEMQSLAMNALMALRGDVLPREYK